MPVAMASMFVIRLRCVSTTPFGSLVEPDENWTNAMSPGAAAWRTPGRAMSVISSMNTTCPSRRASEAARSLASAKALSLS